MQSWDYHPANHLLIPLVIPYGFILTTSFRMVTDSRKTYL